MLYPVSEFQNQDVDTLVDDLSNHLRNDKLSEVNNGQIEAWKESISLLHCLFRRVPSLSNAMILFEYQIPLGGGRRPDTIIFHGETIYLIEFKNKASYLASDIDQLKGYYNDLKLYHSYACQFKIKPILVLLQNRNGYQSIQKSMNIVSADVFQRRMSATIEAPNSIDAEKFLNATFKPILPIEQYAKQIFNKTKIENIESIQIESIETVYKHIEKIKNEAEHNKHHALILISGEPGSGKSALGLRLAHDFEGLYCSKNKKFIEYLHSILGHKVNITDNYSFIREYALGDKIPETNVFVFDEAQRMWDGYKPKNFWNIDDPEQIIVLNSCFQKEWGVLVALIGIGQQLGYDEREHFNSWLVDDPTGLIYYASSKLNMNEQFINNVDDFHLTGSLRSYQTCILNRFIENLLEGRGDNLIEDLKPIVTQVIETGYSIYLSRDISKINKYLTERYNVESNAHCFMATSHVETLESSTFSNDFQESRKLNVKQYLESNGRISNDKGKTICISPYDVQGLELNMPIIHWEEDFLWYDNNWNFPFITAMEGGQWQIINAYRVMLSRGRDGILLYIPNEWDFNSTYSMFRDIGIPELK